VTVTINLAIDTLNKDEIAAELVAIVGELADFATGVKPPVRAGTV
jgi:hypothetical protein